jgi:hypothetical protein
MRDIRLVMSESTYRKIRIEMVRSGMTTPSAVIWALIERYLPDDALPGVLASEADSRRR